MKKSLTLALALSVAVAGIGISGAANAKMRQHQVNLPTFSDFDANVDGVITMDEIKAFGENKFAMADANSDGFLDASELATKADEHGANGPQGPKGSSDHNGPQDHKGPHGQRGQWGPKGPEGAERDFAKMASVMIEKMDTDSDGLISKDEAKGPVARAFDDADTNGDGFLSAEELQAGIETRAQPHADRPSPEDRVARMIAAKDQNGDGLLSADELAPKMEGKIFERMDADKDGNITRAEWDAVIGNMGGHGFGHRFGHGPNKG